MIYVTDRGYLAYISHISEWQVGGSHLAKTNQQTLSEVILPWILGGLLLVSVAGSLCHMMPGLGGGSRMKNSNYRIPPSWTPESNSSYGFLVHMIDITHGAMLTNSALHYQCSAAFMHSGSQTREPTHTTSLGDIVAGGRRDRRLPDPVTCLVGVALYCLWSGQFPDILQHACLSCGIACPWSGCSHPATCLACVVVGPGCGLWPCVECRRRLTLTQSANLLGRLQSQLAIFEEDTRPQKITETLALAMGLGESTNAFGHDARRCESRCQRNVHFVISIERRSPQISIAAGKHTQMVSEATSEVHSEHVPGCGPEQDYLSRLFAMTNQLTTFLQRYGCRLPSNEIAYQALATQVRRQEQIQEATSGNTATTPQSQLDRFARVPTMRSPTTVRLNSSRAAGNYSLIVKLKDAWPNSQECFGFLPPLEPVEATWLRPGP